MPVPVPDLVRQAHDFNMAAGDYDLPPGYGYEPVTMTVFNAQGGVDAFRTGRVRLAVAREKQAREQMEIQAAVQEEQAAQRARTEAAQAAAFRRSGARPDLPAPAAAPEPPPPPVYAAPLSTLPAPVPDAPADPAQARALLTLQAAEAVRNYRPYIAQVRSHASQLSAAGREAETGAWLDYADRLDAWLQSLCRTYNVC